MSVDPAEPVSAHAPANVTAAPPTDSADADAQLAVSRGVRRGIAAYTIWGLLTIYWKQLSGFDALELIAWRMLCAGILMAVIVTIRGSWPRLRAAFSDRRTLVRLMIAAALLTGNWGSYVWAVVNDRVIETALGYFIAPLATMAIGVFVLREQPTVAQRVAFGLAAIAVVILTIANGAPPWIALLLATTWSLYGLSKRRIGLDAIDSLAGETFVLLLPSIVFLLVVSGSDTSVASTADLRDWAFVLGTGAVTAIPLMLFASAAQSIPFTLLGPLNLIVPVINFGLGWLLYDEAMPAIRVIGFAFVWVALLAVMYDRIHGGPRTGPKVRSRRRQSR
ncbi:EamA family transporter RarD [Ilumatobacter sp.]|uniref:EamA family transporter RarD n=1 Tax=Ilumatobacter sp. TaxID=1967498 RepID=UPI003C557DB1